ncbi:MAG: hypothetical protein B6I36_02445 [Desulfobacteraceae bacterium 4572_35.1]|nr:MAG: hypothetical protein B6I36_02445 [Desulfobacteraceae bacterium 4572_35.1]
MRTGVPVLTVRIAILVSILLFSSAQLWATTSINHNKISAEQLLARIQQRFNPGESAEIIHNVQTNFYQKALIASLNRTQTGRGTMIMMFDHSNGNGTNSSTLFHWSYTVPSKQEVICDGKTLWVYQPDNSQVMVSAVNDKSYYSEDPLLFLRNLGQLSSHFSVSMGKQGDTNAAGYQLILVPQQPSVYIKSLLLQVPQWLGDNPQQQGFPISSATIIDPSDNRTSIEFRQIKINQKIDHSQFKFAVPTGVDVVHPSDLTLDFK